MIYHQHTLGCGCGMGALGQVSGPGPAGPVQGIRTVTGQVDSLIAAIRRTFGPSATLNRSNFNSIVRRAAAGEIDRFSRDDAKDFILGTASKMVDAVASARQLASIRVSNDTERERNRAAQNAMLGPAALLGDKALAVLRDVRPARSGASGLGQVGLWEVPLAVWVVGGLTVAFLGAAAIAAISIWADADQRLNSASREAERICSSSSPPCSAEDRARIVRELTGGSPLEAGAREVGRAVGGAVAAVILGGVLYGVWRLRSAKAERTRRRAAEELFQ